MKSLNNSTMILTMTTMIVSPIMTKIDHLEIGKYDY